MLIEEAHENGARYSKACEVVGISLRTLQRWKRGCLNDRRKGSKKTVPGKVSQETREEIVAVCNEPRFRDQTPYEIVPQLLTEGRYLVASESTIYRIFLFIYPRTSNERIAVQDDEVPRHLSESL